MYQLLMKLSLPLLRILCITICITPSGSQWLDEDDRQMAEEDDEGRGETDAGDHRGTIATRREKWPIRWP